MKHILSLFVFLSLILVSFRVPHHGWSNYNQDKTLDYVGTIEELKYENPHAIARVKEKDQTWTVVLAPISRMEARGLKEEMLAKGTSIRVVAYPHKEIKDEMRAERIFVNDVKYELR